MKTIKYALARISTQPESLLAKVVSGVDGVHCHDTRMDGIRRTITGVLPARELRDFSVNDLISALFTLDAHDRYVRRAE